MQNCYSNLHILNFFRTRFWFQEGSFGPEMLIYLRSFAFRMLFFLVFAVFLNSWSYWWYRYLVWWPQPQEVQSPLGRGDHIFIYFFIYINMYVVKKIWIFSYSYLLILQRVRTNPLKTARAIKAAAVDPTVSRFVTSQRPFWKNRSRILWNVSGGLRRNPLGLAGRRQS